MRRLFRMGIAALPLLLPLDVQAGPSPLNAETVGDFVVDCQTDRASCSDAIGLAFLQDPHQHNICLPNSTTDYTLSPIAWLEGHPETGPMSRNSGILLALQTVYRC